MCLRGAGRCSHAHGPRRRAQRADLPAADVDLEDAGRSGALHAEGDETVIIRPGDIAHRGQSIVHAHGGGMQVESEVGKGTTFRIYLPALAQVDSSDAPAPPSRLPVRGTGQRIEVVQRDQCSLFDALQRIARMPAHAREREVVRTAACGLGGLQQCGIDGLVHVRLPWDERVRAASRSTRRRGGLLMTTSRLRPVMMVVGPGVHQCRIDSGGHGSGQLFQMSDHIAGLDHEQVGIEAVQNHLGGIAD